MALKNWGEHARYAGSGDRAWVAGLVLDALRHRRSLAARMGDDGPRAAALGALCDHWRWSAEQIADTAAGEPYGPGPLTPAEADALAHAEVPNDAPAPVMGDYPDWLEAPLVRAYGYTRIA